MKIMKQRELNLTLILTLLTVAISLFTSVFAAAPKNNNSLIWKISGNGLEKPSYLFGTIHVICPEDFFLDQKVEKAFEQCDQLVLELDMDEPDFVQEMQNLSINEGMQNLTTQLGEDSYQSIDIYFKENYNVGLDRLGIMKPFSLMSMVFMKSVDCPEPMAYELEFVKRAKANNFEVHGLEELSDQISIFEKVPYNEQMSWVLKYVNDEKANKENMGKLIETYKNQDIDKLLELMTLYPEYKDIEEDLLYKRNEKWIDDIESFIRNKSSFIAVGSAHLGSERGVIQLLRKQGYTLEPLN